MNEGQLLWPVVVLQSFGQGCTRDENWAKVIDDLAFIEEEPGSKAKQQRSTAKGQLQF